MRALRRHLIDNYRAVRRSSDEAYTGFEFARA